MEPKDVHFQNVSERELCLASGTGISFDTRMGCKVVVIVRANGESFPASLTPIPGRIIVDVPDVFVQTTIA